MFMSSSGLQSPDLLPVSGNAGPIIPESLLFFGLLILGAGVVSIVRPEIFWHLRVGRKIPGVPPSKLYLMVLRFGGLLTAALGVLFLYIYFTA